MTQSILESLEKYLHTGCSPKRDDVPGQLIDEGFIECKTRSQIACPNTFCEADARPPNGVGDSNEVTVVCNGTDSHSSTIEKTDLLSCSLEPEAVLDGLCNHLKVERDGIPNLGLPSYISAPTTNGVDVCLITEPSQEEETADQIIRDAIQHDRVVVLLSLQDTVDHIIEIIDRYAMATVRPYPFSKLEETGVLRQLMRSATISRDRKLSVQNLYELDEDDLLVYLSENPGMVGEKLAHLITLRETGGASNKEIANQFEKTCRVAFMMLEGILLPDEGGGEDNFENVADTAFELPQGRHGGFPEERLDGYPEVFSVVDAKSGQEARLDKEEIITKHKRYLARTSIHALRNHHISHVIVTHELSGAEDIRWYNRLKEAYKGDYSVVIVKTNALYQLVESFAVPLVKNEVNLSKGDPVEVIRPFFDSRVFEQELSPEVQQITRENPPQTKLPERYNSYEEALNDCSELIVVTEEMVSQHLDEVLDANVVKRLHHDYHQQH